MWLITYPRLLHTLEVFVMFQWEGVASFIASVLSINEFFVLPMRGGDFNFVSLEKSFVFFLEFVLCSILDIPVSSPLQDFLVWEYNPVLKFLSDMVGLYSPVSELMSIRSPVEVFDALEQRDVLVVSAASVLIQLIFGKPFISIVTIFPEILLIQNVSYTPCSNLLYLSALLSIQSVASGGRSMYTIRLMLNLGNARTLRAK